MMTGILHDENGPYWICNVDGCPSEIREQLPTKRLQMMYPKGRRVGWQKMRLDNDKQQNVKCTFCHREDTARVIQVGYRNTKSEENQLNPRREL